MITDCFVVKNGGMYFSRMGQGCIHYSDDIQKANRFDSIRGAEFMAKRLGGKVIQCEMKDGVIRELGGTEHE